MKEALVKHLKVTRWLHEYSASIQPILGEPIHEMGGVSIDLSKDNPIVQLRPEQHTHDLQNCVSELAQKNKGKFGYGGYAEDRSFYAVSPLFKNADSNRTIHLGIDVWLPAGTPLFSPLAGEIYGSQMNTNPLDYGGTIITKHNLLGIEFFLLFGHLSKDSIESVSIGQMIDPKQKIAELGDTNENGGWPPHLHLQCIIDMQNHKHDYPGLCMTQKSTEFLYNCPDPFIFLQPPS